MQPHPDLPAPFGWGTGWLAVRAGDPQRIAAEMQLKDPHPSGWQQGLATAQGPDSIFVSPQIAGWSFVIGTALPFLPQEECLDLLVALSLAFGETQYFGNENVTEYHAWAKATEGRLRRAYAFSGEQGAVLCDRGVLTEEETELGLIFPEESILSKSPDDSSVFKISGRWSLDPTHMDEFEASSAPGLLGRMATLDAR